MHHSTDGTYRFTRNCCHFIIAFETYSFVKKKQFSYTGPALLSFIAVTRKRKYVNTEFATLMIFKQTQIAGRRTRNGQLHVCNSKIMFTLTTVLQWPN